MTFTERLRAIQHRKSSLLCVGLDPDPERLPAGVPRTPDGILSFLRGIVESTHDLVCAYKPNLAFFEAMGAEGWTVLRKIVAFVPGRTITIGDAKRGDIGNTAKKYAEALFDDLGFDAVTVNPYMGRDSVEPFLGRPDKGVFLLALTSNAGAADFQKKKLGRTPLYEAVVRASKRWGPAGAVGYVVGATRPSELARIRRTVPAAPILIPGVGAQGGDLAASVRAGCTSRGDLAVINVSRSVLFASPVWDHGIAARREAERLNMAIDAARQNQTRSRSSRSSP